MGLGRVREDPFNEATHRELDGLVMKDTLHFQFSDVAVLEPALQYVLLVLIVHNSNGILDQKYSSFSETPKLVSANEELRELLDTAWEKKSFSEIRNLEILQFPVSIYSCSSRHRPEPLSDLMQERLLSALTSPYRGFAVDGLYEYLEENNRKFCKGQPPNGYYARFCSIVQSSGTGKTRAMIELARKGVLVLYMNLRPVADTTGFPLRDDVPASILTGEGITENMYHVQCYAFFAAIFKLIADDLSDRIENGDSNVVHDWSNSMCQLTSPFRAEFFNRLQSAYTKIKEEFVRASNEAQRKMKSYFYRFTALLDKVFPGIGVHKPKLVIAVDEAHSLQDSQTFRRATILFRVIKECCGSHLSYDAVWVVFASTTFNVAHFTPPQGQLFFNSARVPLDGELVFPPYSEMGWDQHAPHFGSVPALEVGKAKYILRYGRPLWVSLRDPTNLRAIFDLAIRKLSGDSPYKPPDPRQPLAFIAQRFGLEICFGHHEAAEYEKMSVASQCRVCISTTENRLWSYTIYPSEPFLSCAAAFLLHKSVKNALDVLVTKVDNGLIDIEQCGELAGRLLWLLAKDLFVLRDETDFVDGYGLEAELTHCKMIPVIAFLEFVFGEDFWRQASDADAVKEEFKDAYINFSHWIPTNDPIRRDESEDQLGLEEWTSRHWQRTSAVQCPPNQPLIDKVIPIYFKPTNDRAGCVSHMFITDKARITNESGALCEIKRVDSSIGGEEYSSDYPYITIVADLRPDKSGTVSVAFPTRTSDDARCLCIHAPGLDTDTYPFLRENEVIFTTLQHLIRKYMSPRPGQLVQCMRDEVQFGSSAEVRHMEWERWKKSGTAETVPQDPQTQERYDPPVKG